MLKGWESLGLFPLLDEVLIVNEVVEEAKTKKNSCFIFKADFEKA